MSRSYKLAATDPGQRLDRFLCDRESMSRASARRLIDAGQVRVNGRRAAAGQRLTGGDEVTIAETAVLEPGEPEPELALEICYEDAWLVVVNKPAGVPSHPLRSGDRGTVATALVVRYPEMAGVGYSAREPGIVHRLDTDTSGLLLAARNATVFTALRGQLERAEIDKRYLALCVGRPPVPSVHQGWLSARGRRVVLRDQPWGNAQLVSTELLLAQGFGAYSLVEARVHLARRHQVRAHLAALGHPLAGDQLYGGPELPGLRGHFLHASQLALAHPDSGALLTVRAELPPDRGAVLQSIESSQAPA
jgi:23S rRNA pseudouridine1911/1915/1917 synthase